MNILKIISKVVGTMLSISVIVAIFMTMGWHNSPVVKPFVRPAKKIYEKTLHFTGLRKEEGVIYSAFSGFKNTLGKFSQRLINNLIDFVSMTIPKYVLLTAIGLLLLRRVGFISW